MFLSNWEAIRLLIYKDILDKGNKNLNLSRCKVGADEIALILLINLIIFSFFFSIILFKILLFLIFLVFIIKIKNLNIIKFLTLSYISLAFYFLINFQMNQNFINYLTFIVFFAIIVDVSAYFTGKSFGGRKLAVNLSPNKTVSGSVGGVIIPVIICLVFFGKSHNYLEIVIFSLPEIHTPVGKSTHSLPFQVPLIESQHISLEVHATKHSPLIQLPLIISLQVV